MGSSPTGPTRSPRSNPYSPAGQTARPASCSVGVLYSAKFYNYTCYRAAYGHQSGNTIYRDGPWVAKQHYAYNNSHTCWLKPVYLIQY
ncbi:MAG: hypothetical protein LBD51_01155 [Bifidobacteriaceae bacterium]|nr:hypothetical protein [Bifidobacteriaceae bacterium]